MIRQAEIKDVTDIADLSEQLGYATTELLTTQNLLAILRLKHEILRVYEQDGKVVGWIQATVMYRLESEIFLEIVGLVVDVDYRQRGIGRQLVDTICELAFTQKISKVRLRSNVIRTAAHTFYRNMGFSEIKTQKVFERRVGS